MNNRQLKIVMLLKKVNKDISVNDLAEQFLVSRRTIFNDLNNIEESIKPSGYELIRNEGKGLRINKVDLSKRQNIDPEDFFKANRKYEILRLILFEDSLDLHELTEKLFFSESSILNDINFINEVYLKNLSGKIIIGSTGLYIHGNEVDIEKTYIKFNELILRKLRQSLINLEDLDRNYYYFISKLFGEDIVNNVKSIIYNYVSYNSQKIAEYYFENIINALIVLVYRKLNNYSIENSIYGNELYINDDARLILKETQNVFDILFNEYEMAYFSEILHGNNITPISPDSEDSTVDIFLSQLSEILNIDINDDEILIKQLQNHFPTMLYRIQNNIYIDNPFLYDIKREYTTLFNSIRMVTMLEQESFKGGLNDQEIGLLTIYIQSSLDRNKKAKKIILHINDRLANSEFMKNRILNLLPNVEILVKNEDYKKRDKDIDDVDLIITTSSNIQNSSIPIVQISPIVTDEDLKNISDRYYNTIFKDNKYRAIKNKEEVLKILDKYFLKEFTIFNNDLNSKKEMMHYAIGVLLSGDIIEKEYEDTIITRENLGSTELDYLISTPHGSPDYVKKSCVLTLINKNSIIWSEKKVNIMFMINVNKHDMDDLRILFNIIYNISENKNLINELIKTNDYESFINLIRKEILND